MIDVSLSWLDGRAHRRDTLFSFRCWADLLDETGERFTAGVDWAF